VDGTTKILPGTGLVIRYMAQDDATTKAHIEPRELK
jgi:hypothetical protein